MKCPICFKDLIKHYNHTHITSSCFNFNHFSGMYDLEEKLMSFGGNNHIENSSYNNTYGIHSTRFPSETYFVLPNQGNKIYFDIFVEPFIIDDVIRFDLLITKLKNLIAFS